MKILMIEDDKTTIEVIRLTLEVHDPDSTITSEEKGRDGLEMAKKEPFDVVVLDLGLPDIDGIEVLEELRKFSQTPVLIVSARHDPGVINQALGLGAQDYILKPFRYQSFLTSLQEVTTQSSFDDDRETVRRMTEDLTLFTNTREVFVKGNRVEITRDEWIILNKLIEHCGRMVPVKVLSEILARGKFVGEFPVYLIVNQLRKKLGDDPSVPRIIDSEYEYGYRFCRSKVLSNAKEKALSGLKAA
jgi:DNA-binding response OmpR family regulator